MYLCLPQILLGPLLNAWTHILSCIYFLAAVFFRVSLLLLHLLFFHKICSRFLALFLNIWRHLNFNIQKTLVKVFVSFLVNFFYRIFSFSFVLIKFFCIFRLSSAYPPISAYNPQISILFHHVWSTNETETVFNYTKLDASKSELVQDIS